MYFGSGLLHDPSFFLAERVRELEKRVDMLEKVLKDKGLLAQPDSR